MRHPCGNTVAVGRQRGHPVVIGEEDLGDIGRHESGVDTQRGQRRRVTVHPLHPIRGGFATGHVERRRRWIDTGDGDPALGEQARERSGATADIQHRASAELGNHVGIDT
jgi:hypothetical protein